VVHTWAAAVVALFGAVFMRTPLPPAGFRAVLGLGVLMGFGGGTRGSCGSTGAPKPIFLCHETANSALRPGRSTHLPGASDRHTPWPWGDYGPGPPEPGPGPSWRRYRGSG
jgi:hypothetical protein